MYFRTIAAAFFLARPLASADVQELARRAGVTNARRLSDDERRGVGRGQDGQQVVLGVWGAFGDAWCTLDTLERHECLQIYAPMNHYLDALPAEEDDQDDHRAAVEPFVATFRDACLGVEPEVAILDTRAHYGDEDWDNKLGSLTAIRAMYPLVLAGDANALADERFPLLYLNDTLRRRWESNNIRDDRDMVETPSGFLVFGRSGPYRLA